LVFGLWSARIKRLYTRKKSLAVSLGATGFALLAVYFNVREYISLNNVTIVTGIIAKAGVTVFYGILMTYTSELYPTQLRSRAYGVCMVSGRFSMIVMPFFLAYMNQFEKLNAPLVLSMMLFISIAFLRCLPETYEQDMEEYKVDWAESVLKLEGNALETSKMNHSGIGVELMELERAGDRSQLMRDSRG
jgi:MFS family permease